MAKSVLITGGCGFIGANLIPLLNRRGCAVRVLDNLSRGRRELLDGHDYDFIKGDIRDSDAVAKAVTGVDAVIHLAAYGSVIESISDPMTNYDINGRGSLCVLEAAKNEGVEKFVFASTGGALIGNAEPPVNETSAPRPVSPYGASKLVGEGYCCAYAGSYGLATVILRFGNVYGPYSAHKKGAVTVFAKALLRDEPFVIFGDGSASRDLLHVDDLCTGIIAALDRDNLRPATVLHLATGVETSVKQLAATMADVAGRQNHPIKFRAARSGEVHRNFADCTRAHEVLGFSAGIPLREGMRETWDWFVTEGERALAVEATDS